MGNFSSKDNHGGTGVHVDSFHTPPSSPQSDGAAVIPSAVRFQASPAVPASLPPPALGITPSGKKSKHSTPASPSTPIPPPDWRPPPPVSSNASTIGPGVSPLHKKSGSTAGANGQASLGKNGGPPTSSPGTSVSQVMSVAVSPIGSPSLVCSSSPTASSLDQNSREKESGPSQSLLAHHENKDIQSEELVRLLEECRKTLSIDASQDGTPNTTGKNGISLDTEVSADRSEDSKEYVAVKNKNPSFSLQTERGEWLQFQADLQVAVAVADRLRAEAEEELTALRAAHKDTDRELAAAQQRQKEAEVQLATVQGELKESRQRLATMTQAPDKPEAQSWQEPDRPKREYNSENKEGTERGRGRGLHRLGGVGLETGSQNEVMKSVDAEGARIDCKGVAKRYLRNVTNEDRDGKDMRTSETRRMQSTERSRSLSRLPASSDTFTLQNGTPQSNGASTLGSTTRNFGELRGRRSLDWQESKSSNDTGKREESLNKYNSALTELPPSRPQDGFNLLLRRHGGSKRNSLLRWCQSRTQGYKNIDITNFSSSWADGLAFCAVYHTYLPSHVAYSTLTPENKRENLSLAFKTGEAVGIEQSLTVEEMLRAGGPDWQRVLNYVESIYRHFEMCTTSFLISSPEVLHAGTAAPLAVTVYANFSSRVTAEVAHGDVRIPGSISQNSLLNLTVRGYKEDILIFTDTTTVSFDLRNVSSFIQTDRSRYKPGDTVKVRVVSVQLDNRPYKGRIGISLQIHGSTQFFFSRDHLQALHSSAAISSKGHVVVNIAACVNDTSTGFKMNKTVKVYIMQNTYQLMFLDISPSLKPSLHFSANLRISRYDRKPLSSWDLVHPAVVEVTQRASLSNTEPTTLTLPVPEDGNVQIWLKLQNQIAVLLIRARFQSSEETLTVYSNYSSPSGSYIQISPVSNLPAKVSSNGQVVAAGTKNSSSFSLTPALSWSPQACVTVYCILSDGELVSDTVHIPLHSRNLVTLNWSSEKARPGEQVSLTVAASESRFRVAVVVMGTSDNAPLSDLGDHTLSQECHLTMLTNARQYKKQQPAGPKNEDEALLDKAKGDFIEETYRSHWPDTTESLLWLDADVSGKMWTSGKITVPDGVTSLRAVAVVMSENLGLTFTPVPQTLTVTKDFSLSLAVPPHLIRGEEIVLEIKAINHLEHDIEVIVLLAQSEAFNFVLMDRKDVSVINAQKFNIGSHASASALFPIRPLALGEMEISVDAVSAETSDALIQKVLVKPEGVEQSFSQTLFLELEPQMHNNSKSISISFPPLVVPGTPRAHMALVGDILALSIGSLDSLVQIPVGCGEQNMIHFAPSVYVLQYLEKSTQDDKEIRSKALHYMKEGYQKQLSYQRDDGSFSAFGMSDTSGNTWLTAFVLRCFLQAQPYIQVDQMVLKTAMAWLLKHQGPQGEFSEVGRLIHTEMQGGLDDGPVALTAFVLLAFLEDGVYSEMYESNVSLALRYLESKVASGLVSNYSLCLVAYALSLGNSPVAGRALTELSRRADFRDGVMMWASSGQRSRDWRPRSAQIEMTSYMLLALFMRGSFIEGIALMKWLSTQRNHLGGFGTTQDTVVALQALAYYAAFSGANAIDLRFNISSPASSFVSLFHINSTNYRMYQSQEINADRDLPLNIYFEGRGFALFQLNVFYNVESKAFSQTLQHTPDEDVFLLDVDLADDSKAGHVMLSVCTGLKDDQPLALTGMVVLDVGMLSGFTLFPGAPVHGDLIRKVETTSEKVYLYLDSVTKAERCISLPIVRNYKVAHVQDATVQVYDYYEPTRRATVTYNSDFLHNMESCSFCGKNCDVCRPGITITATFPLSAQTVSSTSSSLSCLFLGVAALLILV
ncbi:CD109 antigen [Xenentodon cancila]